jgi:excisionase family DNA binding protein
MNRRLQFDTREGPASDGRHGSRQPIPSATSPSSPDESDSFVVGDCEVHAADASADKSQHRLENSPQLLRPAGAPAATRTFEPLIGSPEAAKLLGNIHIKTLQRYARRGNLPGYRIASQWFFRASELDAWLHSRINSNCQPADRVDLTVEKIP